MSELQLGVEAGATHLHMTMPFIFAGLSGALAVAATLAATAFWRRTGLLRRALDHARGQIADDLSAERVFLIEDGRLTPASPATARFAAELLEDATLRAATTRLFGPEAAQSLTERLLKLVAAAEGFEEVRRDALGRTWRVRGEIEGAHAVLRLTPDAGAALREAPEETEAELSALLAGGLEHAPSGVVLLDGGLRLRAANAAARRLLRLRREQVEQRPSLKTLFDALRDAGRLPERIDFAEWRDAVIADPVARLAEEGVWALPDGSALRVAAERCPGGGVALIVTDETDALALERRYQIAMGARRATFAAIEHGLAVIGADGRLHLANPAFAKLWGLEATLAGDRAAGQASLAQIAREAARDPFDAEIWARIQDSPPLQAGGPRRAERFTAERASDSRVAIQVAPLPEGAVLITCADVSAAHRAERALVNKADALEAADRLKTEFLNDIAHQLRNPLNSVIGFSEMLRQGMAGALSKRQDEYVSYVLAGAHDLRELISDALDLGALNAGALSLRKDEVDVGAVGEGVMGLLSKRAERRGAHFVWEIDEAPLPVAGDETRLRHALYSAGAAVIAAAAAEDMISAALAQRRAGGESGSAVGMVAFGVRLERRQAIDGPPEPLADQGGVALSLAKRIVEVHGGRAYFGETPERVEVILEFPLIDEPAPLTARRRA